MKAITVQQPWAQCIALGAKLVENRSRSVSYRGPLAIHAGMRWSRRGGHDDRAVRLVAGQDALGPISEAIAVDVLGLRQGVVLAVCELVDCHLADGCCQPWGEDEYGGDRVHHLALADVCRLAQPVPTRGQLGLWSFDLPEGALT